MQNIFARALSEPVSKCFSPKTSKGGVLKLALPIVLFLCLTEFDRKLQLVRSVLINSKGLDLHLK